MKDIIISGAGMRCAVGNGVEECYAALCRGESGLATIAAFDRSRYQVRHAYEIQDRPPNPEGEGNEDRIGRASAWLIQAVDEAIAQANLSEEDLDGVPVIVGTGLRELRSFELWWTGQAAGFRADQLDFAGVLRRAWPNLGHMSTLSNACSASNFALGMALDLIRLGQTSRVIVAAADSISESMYGFADRAGLEGLERVQPFDQDRCGVLLGEGAAAVVVESSELARARGAKGLTRLAGVSMNCDAYHETAPSLAGLTAAMEQAQAEAGVQPGDIGLVVTHGTGTLLNDDNEAAALAAVFGEHLPRLTLAALKSMIGHTSGGAALMSLIMGARMLETGVIPPTLGLDNPLKCLAGARIAPWAQSLEAPRLAQIDASGFGGVNAVTIIERI